ncbi:MAG: phosphoribosyltransferase [Candidatus Hodarchaeota archaeon]
MVAPYKDRADAGLVLATQLQALGFESTPLILTIPNGGVAVGVPIAGVLKADLDIIIVRKLQIPHNPEAGFGAITSLGSVILNQFLIARIGLTQVQIDSVIHQTRQQIKRRQQVYASVVKNLSPNRRIVILIDDGLASGYTMLAAIESVRRFSPRRIVVAVPTASMEAAAKVKQVVDDFICPHMPSGFIFAVANAYQHWYDVPDEEVLHLLNETL